ncbi:MAG: transcriptional regulator [Halobacteriales archaeon]|nr:transcriptional regulator [Halobacteriales archaeon]
MSGIFGQARLPTGVEALDRQLEGGLLPGSVVAYLAPPASQSELLLMEMTDERNTLYLSTARTEGAVRDAFEQCPAPTGEPVIEYVPADAPLDNARQLFMNVETEANLIIDPVDTLEYADRNRYQKFLNELQNHMQNTGSVAMLHCISGADEPELRQLTKHMADVVFDLRVVYDGAEVETRLAVPKFRGGRSLDETIKLELGDRVRVDTSRDIA